MHRSKTLAVFIIAFAIVVSFISIASFGQEKVQKEGYVGPEACKECHPDLYEGFTKENPHWKNALDPNVSQDKRGCESCHGPGGKHVEAEGEGSIFSFKNKNSK